MNPNSATQIATFLFGGCANQKTGDDIEEVRVFKTLREDICQEVSESGGRHTFLLTNPLGAGVGRLR